jgi:hypothetical protein
MTRCNINEFERLYLRFTYAQKYLEYADQEILNDNQFKRSINYVVNLYSRKDSMREMMLRAGFEREDLLSIATMFGLIFNGRQNKLGEDSRNFLNMVRFVSQRMQKFSEWVVRKFSIDDTITFGINDAYHTKDDGFTPGQVPANYLDEAFTLGNAVEADALLSRHQEVCQDLEEMRQEFDQFKEANVDDARAIRRGQRRMLDTTKIIRTEKSELTHRLRERRIEQKSVSARLKKKLIADPEKYREELCRYATYKTVASDVRRAARLTCNRLGIDYKTWALQQINSGKIEGYQIAY